MSAIVANRRSFAASRQSQLRNVCHTCRRSLAACYCSIIRPFHSDPPFVLLAQPKEAKHRFGTGRMAHLCIANSLFIEGVDFSEHPLVGRILQNPGLFPVVLYPSSRSLNLSTFSRDERVGLVPVGKKLVVFVIDGTWKTARKMVRLSRSLQNLPFVCFDPPCPSNYRIRKQPRPDCYSTIEAIHHVIDLFFPLGERSKPHDNLLEILTFTVNRQLSYRPN